MKTLKSLLIGLLGFALVLIANAQENDHDLLFTELYNSELPVEEGVISLEEGISGDYELLNYNVLGDLDAVEGRDGAIILVQHSEEGDDYYLYAVLSEQSFPVVFDYELLGRDIALLNLSIEEGQILVEFVAGDEENHYQPMKRVYALDGESLSFVEEGDLEEGYPFIADDVLSAEELGNLTYPLDWFDTPLFLSDGSETRVFGSPEESRTFTYTLRSESIAYGDLNGDGLEDAMVYIAMTVSDVPDEFWTIAAVLNYHGYPQVADSEVDRLGSGVRLEELSIAEDGIVTFTFADMSHGEGLATTQYRLEEGKLVQVSQ
jgi:hypothetical protein